MVETDQRTAQEQERLVDIVTPLIANRESAELSDPRQRPLYHPPVSPQLLGKLSIFFLAICAS
jgi:hypothetical protein